MGVWSLFHGHPINVEFSHPINVEFSRPQGSHPDWLTPWIQRHYFRYFQKTKNKNDNFLTELHLFFTISKPSK